MSGRRYTLGAVGDICLARKVAPALRERGQGAALAALRPVLDPCDVVVGSLESVLVPAQAVELGPVKFMETHGGYELREPPTLHLGLLDFSRAVMEARLFADNPDTSPAFPPVPEPGGEQA